MVRSSVQCRRRFVHMVLAGWFRVPDSILRVLWSLRPTSDTEDAAADQAATLRNSVGAHPRLQARTFAIHDLSLVESRVEPNQRSAADAYDLAFSTSGLRSTVGHDASFTLCRTGGG